MIFLRPSANCTRVGTHISTDREHLSRRDATVNAVPRPCGTIASLAKQSNSKIFQDNLLLLLGIVTVQFREAVRHVPTHGSEPLPLQSEAVEETHSEVHLLELRRFRRTLEPLFVEAK